VQLKPSIDAKASPDGGLSPQSAVGIDLRAYPPLQLLLIALTFVTGVLDAVTYLDFGHVFAANMTGNFILLGLGVLRADDLSVTASVVAVAGFLIGVAGGGRLARSLEPRGQRWVVTSVSSALGVSVLALVAAAYRDVLGEYPALVLLASAMGSINATASRIGISCLTTTVVITSTLTSLVSGTELPHGDTRTRMRQISAVAALVLGAVVGGSVVLRFGAVAAIATGVAVALIATAAYAARLTRVSETPY
jgi:uncharacterized membrane protein YoaK (UPF0700 family)